MHVFYRSRPPLQLRLTTMFVACLGVGGGGGCSEDPIEPVTPDALPDDEGTGTDGDLPPPIVGDLCDDAMEVGPGTVRGTLRGRTVVQGGVCGSGGPDAFHVLEVPQRADVRVVADGRGFEPIAGVLPSACVVDWAGRGLLCAQGVEGWVSDVPAGSTLYIAVGIDSGDPALLSIPEPGSFDPLDYSLDVGLRAVLSAGQVCDAADVRCESGTACLPAEGTASANATVPGGSRCVALEADTCASPEVVLVDRETLRVEVPPSAMHTDAHRHTCLGARSVERVLRLDFPVDGRTPQTVEIRGTGVLGLAVRAGGCEASDEIACFGVETTTSVSVDLDQVAVRDGLFVFVELPAAFAPDPPGEEPPQPAVVDIAVR